VAVTLLDFVVLGIIAIFVIAGAKRGLVWEILTLAGIALGLWIPYAFRFQILDFIERYTEPGQSRMIADVVVFMVIFSVIYITFSHVGYLLHKVLEKILLGWLDRLLGAFLGLGKGSVLIGLVVAAILLSPWHEQGERLFGKSKMLTWGKRQVEKFISREPPELRGRV
jgi:membrane protein required for colicin V production